MYPDFRYLIGALGIEGPQWLGLFKTFGLMVALAFVAAAWALTSELRRKEREGLLRGEVRARRERKPVTLLSVATSAAIGALLGYKIVGMARAYSGAEFDVAGFLFSTAGSPLGALLGALALAVPQALDLRKQKTVVPAPVRGAQEVVMPHQRVMEMVMIAAVMGFVGAKVFNAFESWEAFLANPIESLISSSGFTFYGGLLMAAAAVIIYVRRRGWDVRHLADAFAPALMLAYGVGRIGCQLAGDGDWGIANSAYVTGPQGTLIETGSKAAYLQRVQTDSSTAAFARREFPVGIDLTDLYAPAPSWLPRRLFAMSYPHNVNRQGVALPGCTGEYCTVLPFGVFPTPMYEAVVCIGLFGVFWALRRRIRRPLHLMGIYLVLNGLERFLVEKIRVNYRYDWGFIQPTQAEIISACLMLGGTCILLFYRPDKVLPQPPAALREAA